jgi:hypothetical protein
MNAMTEAHGMLGLVRSGQTPDVVRAQIGNHNSYRKRVRLYFDCLVARIPKHGGRLRKYVNPKAISAELRETVAKMLRARWSDKEILAALPIGRGFLLQMCRQIPRPRGRVKSYPGELKQQIAQMLRANKSHRQIRKDLHVGESIVLRISKKIGAAYLKPHGRCRRFTPEFTERIRAAVQAKQRSAQIERELGIDYKTVIKFRRQVGDREDRRFWSKLSEKQIAQAEAWLAGGMRWRDVSARLGCGLGTLQRATSYRKRRKP